MQPLVVQIQRPNEGRSWTRAYTESPVRIGRSPFASLRLRDPFVSEWQAVVRFHGQRTTYLDLGSKNPTCIAGKPVERNVEVEVDENTEVCIGSLRLRFSRNAEGQPVSTAPPPDEETAFMAHHWAEPDRPTGTIMLDAPAGAQPSLQLAAAAVPHRSPPPLPDAGLAGAHRAQRSALEAFLAAVQKDLDQTLPARRAERVHALVARFPDLVKEPSFRERARTYGVEPVQLGHIDVEYWLGRLCGMPASAFTPAQSARTMERVGQLLEIFASSFIESRRAHQRARRRLAIERDGSGRTLLQQTEDPHALLAYLLASEEGAATRSHELRRLLADFAMHQIALLSAVVEGARSVLEQLAPAAVHEAHEPAHGAAVLDRESAFGGSWPFTARKLWRKYLVLHHDLTQTDHFARELFGREFMRRYHAIADTASNINKESQPS
jgi:predicted component of type VI protein secretion system